MSGCNIVPKSVQYQEEEEAIVGSTDIANPLINELQVVLTDLGYDTGNTDGRMCPKTRSALKEFQESMGLKSTGYVDKRTWMRIEDTMRENEKRRRKEEYPIEVRSAYESRNEIPDVSNVTTKEIQAALKKAGFDPGSIDGKLGPRTTQAIKEFQRIKGLKVDGKVGLRTWSELGKYLY